MCSALTFGYEALPNYWLPSAAASFLHYLTVWLIVVVRCRSYSILTATFLPPCSNECTSYSSYIVVRTNIHLLSGWQLPCGVGIRQRPLNDNNTNSKMPMSRFRWLGTYNCPWHNDAWCHVLKITICRKLVERVFAKVFSLPCFSHFRLTLMFSAQLGIMSIVAPNFRYL